MRVIQWLKDTITVARATGAVDSYGQKTYGTQTTLPARVELKKSNIRRPDGTDLSAEASIATEDELKIDDRVWLASDSTAAEPRIVLWVETASTKPGNYKWYRSFV